VFPREKEKNFLPTSAEVLFRAELKERISFNLSELTPQKELHFF